MYLMTPPPPMPTPAAFLPGPPLVLDLGGVQSLSAAGIGELVALRSRLRASGGRLVLANVGHYVSGAIEEAGLSDSLGVRPMAASARG
jgi:anti-anti-sigma factor